MFSGFTEEMITFFLGLRCNNNRAYFEENRAVYERAIREPLIALTEALAETVLSIDPQLDTRPARTVSRIHRDIRFSHDQSPYRDYMWIGYRRAGEAREETCGFYFDISAEAAHWGCGFYQENRPAMERLRARMNAAPQQVERIVTEPAFAETYRLEGSAYRRLITPPSTLPETLHTLYIKKSIYAEHTLKQWPLLYSAALVSRLQADFCVLAPFYNLLRGCLTEDQDEAIKGRDNG